MTRAVSLEGTRVAIKAGAPLLVLALRLLCACLQTVPKLPVSKSKRRRTAEKLQQEAGSSRDMYMYIYRII